MSIRRMLAMILAACILAAAPLAALAGRAGPRARDAKMYDRSGRYQGRVTSDGRGQTRAYDKSGRYRGRTMRQGRTIKIYDRSGRYQGRITVR